MSIVSNSSYQERLIDWNYYLRVGQEQHAVWAGRLDDMTVMLYSITIDTNEASKALPACKVVTHGDLDPKNVMWVDNKPVIIDWESAGFINPLKDLICTALYWSEDTNGDTDKTRLTAFVSSYKECYGTLNYTIDWESALLSSLTDKIGWLEYSLKRSLWLDCADENEQKLGTEQVLVTFDSIERYLNQIIRIKKWLNEI
jgi:thiamine kinase-like enzyme